MKRATSSLSITLLAICWLRFLTACPGGQGAAPDMQDGVQTVLRGRAPMNGGGLIRVWMAESLHDEVMNLHLEPGQPVADDVCIDSDGHFEAPVGKAYGAFVVEARSGSYAEPGTGKNVNMGHEILRATVYDVKPQTTTDVTIGPWSELLHAYNQKNPGKNAQAEARALLEAALGCSDQSLTSAAPVMPRKDVPLQTPQAPELAYLHLGAWSMLAKQVGIEANLPGISTIRLVRALANAMERDGRLEKDIEIANKATIGADVLRQPFAQAMRAFLHTSYDPNLMTIQPDDVSDVLHCISEAPASVWGPTGTPFDGRLPTIEMDNDKVVAFVTEISCKARHSSGIVGVTITADQGLGIEQGEVILASKTTRLGDPEVLLTATFNPKLLAAGNANIVCRATDAWGNTAEKTAVLHINKGQPPIEMNIDPAPTVRDDRKLIEKTVRVTCICDDRYPAGDDSCRLSDESLAFPGLTRVDSRVPGSAAYAWDTTQANDGERVLTCQASTLGVSEPVPRPYKVVVSNHRPLSVRGVVGIDSLVKNMRVQAWAWRDNGTKGVRLGEAEARDGTFTILLDNEYVGPVLFEATPLPVGTEKASFRSAATMQRMDLEPHHRLSLLWDGYTPAHDMPDLYINAATTLAEAYATSLITLPGSDTLGDATLGISKAHDFFAQYMFADFVDQDQPRDVRLVPVAGVTEGEHTAFRTKSRLLGLFHAGLSRLAAEQSRPRDGQVAPEHLNERGEVYSAMDFVAALTEDFSDGAVLNGKSKTGHFIRVNQYVLNRDTLRRDLAQSINKWLKNAPILGRTYHASQMRAADYARPGKFLRLITGSTAAVFGEKPSDDFDDEAPELTVMFRQEPGGLPLANPHGQVFGGVVEIKVDAVDDSVVTAISVKVAGVNNELQPLRPFVRESEASAMYRWGTPMGRKEKITLIVSAIDEFDNKSTQSYTLEIDNVAPEVTVSPKWKSKIGDITIKGRVNKPYAKVSLLTAGKPPIGETLQAAGGNLTEFSISGVVECNKHHDLEIKVTDFAGNSSPSVPITLMCDNTAPVVEFMPVRFFQEFTGSVVDVREGVIFEKYMHRLDDDLDGRDAVNLPQFALRVSDQWDGRVGYASEELQVEWSYRFASGSHSYSSSWRELPLAKKEKTTNAGLYKIVLSYQSLLPEAILGLPLGDVRRSNFVALSQKQDKYTIAVRARDPAGNKSAEKELTFGIDVKAAPVKISCSAAQPNLLSLILGARVGGSPGAATLSWKDDAHRRSLAPRLVDAVANVRIGGKSVSYTVNKAFHEVKVSPPFEGRIDQHPVLACRQAHKYRWEWVRRYDDNGDCSPHDYPTESNSWEDHRAGPLATYTQQTDPTTTYAPVKGDGEDVIVKYIARDGVPLTMRPDRRGKERASYVHRTSMWAHHKTYDDKTALMMKVAENSYARTVTLDHGWSQINPQIMQPPHLPPVAIEMGASCFLDAQFMDP